jgi:hypothetical protein
MPWAPLLRKPVRWAALIGDDVVIARANLKLWKNSFAKEIEVASEREPAPSRTANTGITLAALEADPKLN